MWVATTQLRAYVEVPSTELSHQRIKRTVPYVSGLPVKVVQGDAEGSAMVYPPDPNGVAQADIQHQHHIEEIHQKEQEQAEEVNKGPKAATWSKTAHLRAVQSSSPLPQAPKSPKAAG